MSDLKPGIYKATVRGVPDVLLLSRGGSGYVHETIEHVKDELRHHDHDVTDARPLVILDLDFIRFERFGLPKVLESLSHWTVSGGEEIARQIKAQTKPPKPAEPTGLGAVVEDACGAMWVRLTDDGEVNKHWRNANAGAFLRHWDAIDAVRVLSEGVKP